MEDVRRYVRFPFKRDTDRQTKYPMGMVREGDTFTLYESTNCIVGTFVAKETPYLNQDGVVTVLVDITEERDRLIP